MDTNIQELLEVLDACKHVTTLVEGPNDRKALENLGFTDIVEIDGPLYRVAERLQQSEEVCILTDLDAAGKKLYHYFYKELTGAGVKINNRARLALFRTDVRQIEGLTRYLRRQSQ